MSNNTSGRGLEHAIVVTDASESARWQIARQVLIFQVKLAADGLRDLILSPVSLAAGIAGVIIGGRAGQVPFQQVLRLGRRTERWIDLFGAYPRQNAQHDEANIDTLAAQVEDFFRREYEKGDVPAATRARFDEILNDIARHHRQRRGNHSGKEASGEARPAGS